MKKSILVHLLLLILFFIWPFRDTRLGNIIGWGLFCAFEFAAVFLLLNRYKLNTTHLIRVSAVFGIFTLIYIFRYFEDAFIYYYLLNNFVVICLSLFIYFLTWIAGIFVCIRIMGGKCSVCLKPDVLIFALLIVLISTAVTSTLKYYSLKHSLMVMPFTDESILSLLGVIYKEIIYIPYIWVWNTLLPFTTFYGLTLLLVRTSVMQSKNVTSA